jgi:hypothetical protein
MSTILSLPVSETHPHTSNYYTGISMKSPYRNRKEYAKEWYKNAVSTKSGKIKAVLQHIRVRAKKKSISFSLTLDHLIAIAPDKCPVFGIPFIWDTPKGKASFDSPSLDRINPALGYVDGNVQWLSLRANAMKQDANLKELKQFAQWALSQQP